jgi:hypothetical protein
MALRLLLQSNWTTWHLPISNSAYNTMTAASASRWLLLLLLLQVLSSN